MIEIEFKNIKEIEKFLNYLDTIEFDSELKSCYGDSSFKEMFVEDLLQDEDLTESLMYYDLNDKTSKLIWGIWIEDGKKILDDMYNSGDNSYNKIIKYTQFFEECFTTKWEEREEEKEKIRLSYNKKIKELEKQVKELIEQTDIEEKKYQKELEKINEKYSKKVNLI